MQPPLIDLSNRDLKEKFREEAELIPDYAYRDLVVELDRRSRNRQALGSFILSLAGLVIAVAAFVVTGLKA